MNTYDGYIEGWRRRWEAEREENERLAARALELLPTLAGHLKRAYGARRVFLFGSLAEGRFRRGSDIDLAAEDLPGGAAIYRAAAELDELAAPFEVQLVPLEDAEESLRRKILHSGVLVDAR